MRLSFTFVLTGSLAVFGLSGNLLAGWNDRTEAEAGQLIDRFLRPSGAAHKVAALSVAIGINGDLVWGRGMGEEAAGRPATIDTVYRIGSITKQFTAAAILRLREIGAVGERTGQALQLSSPVSDFIDGVDAWSASGQNPITVRSLLNMTSNLPNYTRRPPDGLDPWGTVASHDLLAALKGYRPRGWPGSFEYSNTSYFILSEMAGSMRLPDGRLAGGLHDFLRDDIFKRAGMRDTGFAGEHELESRLPIASYKRKPVFSSPDWLRGSADMLSTAADLFRWNAALLSGDIIASPSLDDMLSEGGRVSPTTYYGMGWFIRAEGAWTHYSHTGSVAGFTSCNAIARAKDGGDWISVSLLSSADGVDGLEQLADDILQLIERH